MKPELSYRTADLLELAGYRSREQIASTPDAELLRIPGIGRRMLREIRDAIPFENKIKCSGCAYWHGYHGYDDTVGECRKTPPQVFMPDKYEKTEWPRTKAADWCGEAKDRTT